MWDREVIFAAAHKYTSPPMNVAHEGGVFATYTLSPKTEEAQQLLTTQPGN